MTRRALLRRGLVAGAGLTAIPALVAACGGGNEASTGTSGGGLSSPPASGADVSMDDLIAAAKQEGTLNTIALPPDWANYGEIMKTFTDKYGIKINERESQRLLGRGEPGRQVAERPGPRSRRARRRPAAAAEGRTAACTRSTRTHSGTRSPMTRRIPTVTGSPITGERSLWAPTRRSRALPQSWADLKKPEYKGKVALNGDPRESGSAFAGVLAAAVANGGSLDDIQPGSTSSKS